MSEVKARKRVSSDNANFKLGDLTRALIAAGRAGTPVREVTIDGAGRLKMVMAVPGDEPAGPPTDADLADEKAELDRLVAADKPA